MPSSLITRPEHKILIILLNSYHKIGAIVVLAYLRLKILENLIYRLIISHKLRKSDFWNFLVELSRKTVPLLLSDIDYKMRGFG